MRRRLLALACCSLLALAAAQAELASFLAPLQRHPAARAAAASVAAAQFQLDGTYEPFALSLSGGLSAFANEDIDLAPDLPGQQGLPTTGGQLSAELTIKPFPLPELVDQATIALEQAKLDYRDTLTGLEVQALSAALQLQLAEQSLALSRQSAEVAGQALAATRLRFERGAATGRELRDAEAGYFEAEALVLDAEHGLELARLSLEQLVLGRASLDVAALRLPVPSGTPLSVARAQLARASAELGSRVAGKALLPVVQAGYSWNLDERSNLGLALETRTLQPRVSYSYQDPGRSPPQDAVRGSFQVGVSLEFSAANIAEADAARAQLEAADAGLRAAWDSGELQRRSLENALARAERQLELAQRRFGNVQANLNEAREREALGLGVPLETQQAALALGQETLELQSARQDVLLALLELYRFHAMPPSEVAR